MIETFQDLPQYGKYVLVLGKDKGMYGILGWHVCEMNDLEDGMDFIENGNFYWITESGRKIEDVIEWCELPNEEEIKLIKRERVINKLI